MASISTLVLQSSLETKYRCTEVIILWDETLNFSALSIAFLGRWGGIWEAQRGYTFTAEDNKQTDIKLIQKFDNWKYANNGIEKRMPWISGARLTTSSDAYSDWWGTITGR